MSSLHLSSTCAITVELRRALIKTKSDKREREQSLTGQDCDEGVLLTLCAKGCPNGSLYTIHFVMRVNP